MKPRKRISIRIVVAGVIALQLATIVALAATTLNTSEDVLRSEIEIAIERDATTAAASIDRVLRPATEMAHIIEELIETSILETTSNAEITELFITELDEEESALVSGMFVGRADGSFLFVNRDDSYSPGGYRVKTITTNPTREVDLHWRDSTGTVFATDRDPDDAYDPRSRSWYQLATTNDSLVWTEPYVFFTARQPGVTAALELPGNDSSVVGIDIEISSLGTVLSGVGSTENAKAFLLDRQGRILALPGATTLTVDPTDPDRLTFATVNEIEDTTVRGAIIQVLEQDAPSIGDQMWTPFTVDGQDHHAVFTPLDELGWTLGVSVPDSDYSSPLDRARARSILFALFIGVGSLVMGAGISRSVVGPMRRLQGKALDSLAGQGTMTPPVASRIREIDDAAAALREAQEDLERKVVVRTRALETEITTRKAAEVQAEAANRAKSEFLGNMSHELRTPLSSIIGLSDIMLEAGPDDIGPEEKESFIADINAAGIHLLALIKDLLDLSRIEADELDLERESILVVDNATEAMTMVATRAADTNVKLRQDIHEDLVISADPLRFKQILINLLSNAVKFTPPGGEVSVSTLRSAAGVRLSVADTGIGMTSDQLREARTVFGQVTNSLVPKTEGTGLGLTLVERLTEAHGWRWDIESDPDVGTTVWILIPGSDLVTP